jgi:hypothetical protein
VRITATDGYGGTNPTIDFNFVANSRPIVTAYSDLIQVVGDSISVVTPFTDPDGDTLTYSAVFQNGSATITPFGIGTSTGTLTATFNSSQEGRYAVVVTAVDTSSNSISSTQNVIVNSAPVADQTTLTDMYASDAKAFSYTLPSAALIDTDALTYTIAGTIPAWLSFDAEQQLFYGTAVDAQADPSVTITSTDTLGQAANVIINITVSTDANPTLVGTIAGQSVKNNASYSIQFADTVFRDADNEPVEITFERNAGGAMPSWWSYNPITRIAAGFCNTSETSIVVKVWGGASVSTTFTLTIAANNDPLVGTTISSFTVYQDIDFNEDFDSASFTDPDGDSLSYYIGAVDEDNPIPIWVDLTSATRRIHGYAGASVKGVYQINVVADDARGGNTFQTVTITVKASYSIISIIILSLMTILPVFLMFGYLGAILFIPHESPKYFFDLKDFMKKYDPSYTPDKIEKARLRQLNPDETEDDPILDS